MSVSNPGTSVSVAASYGRLKDFPGIPNKKNNPLILGGGGQLLFRGFASKANNSESVSWFWSVFLAFSLETAPPSGQFYLQNRPLGPPPLPSNVHNISTRCFTDALPPFPASCLSAFPSPRCRTSPRSNVVGKIESTTFPERLIISRILSARSP